MSQDCLGQGVSTIRRDHAQRLHALFRCLPYYAQELRPTTTFANLLADTKQMWYRGWFYRVAVSSSSKASSGEYVRILASTRHRPWRRAHAVFRWSGECLTSYGRCIVCDALFRRHFRFIVLDCWRRRHCGLGQGWASKRLNGRQLPVTMGARRCICCSMDESRRANCPIL